MLPTVPDESLIPFGKPIKFKHKLNVFLLCDGRNLQSKRLQNSEIEMYNFSFALLLFSHHIHSVSKIQPIRSGDKPVPREFWRCACACLFMLTNLISIQPPVAICYGSVCFALYTVSILHTHKVSR